MSTSIRHLADFDYSSLSTKVISEGLIAEIYSYRL